MTEKALPSRERSELRFRNILLQGFLIFTALLSIYAITYSGVPRVEDEQLIAARAQSLIHWQAWNFPQLSGNDRIRHLALVEADEADFNAAVEPLGSVLAGFFHSIALTLGGGGTQGALVSNLYITALTAVVLYFLLLSMEFDLRVASLGALLFGLGTMAWPYTKTLFRDVLLMLFTLMVVLGYSLSLHAVKRKKAAGVLLVILGLIGAVLTKRTGWVLVPALVVATLLNWRSRAKTRGNRRWIVGAAMLGLLFLIGGTLVASSAGLFARYSSAHFTFVFQRLCEGLGVETLPAILGPFLSPGKSIFLFSPILLLAPFGLIKGWKAHRPIFILALATILILVTAQSLFYRGAWAGIPVWGLRFMLLSMPLMVVFSAPIIDQAFSSSGMPLRWPILGLSALSIVIQIAGAAVSWHTPLVRWARTGWNPYAPGSVWNLANLPIPIHLSALFNPGKLDMAWLRLLPMDQWAVALPALFLLLAGICMGLLFRTYKEPNFRGKLPPIVILLLVALGLILPLYPSLRVYREDPAAGGGRSTYQEMLTWLAPQIQPDDLVIVDSYGTPLWQFMMNHWAPPVPWYSLPYAPGRSIAHTEIVVGEIIERGEIPTERVWLLRSTDLPDPALAQTLGRNYRLADMIHFAGNPPAGVQVYVTNP
jgi:hypothetical protein